MQPSWKMQKEERNKGERGVPHGEGKAKRRRINEGKGEENGRGAAAKGRRRRKGKEGEEIGKWKREKKC